MQSWRYESAQDLDQPLTERLRHFPREPDMLVYGLRSAAALFFRAWLRVYHRLEILGRENLPETGSFVMVANHCSHLDAVCLASALPLRKLHRAFPAAAADYFFQSVPRIWMAAVGVNALPFARQVHLRQSLSLCEKLLANPGNVLILFPEGTRSLSGEVGRFKPGIGALLAGNAVPVLPCCLHSRDRAWRHQAVAAPGQSALDCRRSAPVRQTGARQRCCRPDSLGSATGRSEFSPML